MHNASCGRKCCIGNWTSIIIRFKQVSDTSCGNLLVLQWWQNEGVSSMTMTKSYFVFSDVNLHAGGTFPVYAVCVRFAYNCVFAHRWHRAFWSIIERTSEESAAAVSMLPACSDFVIYHSLHPYHWRTLLSKDKSSCLNISISHSLFNRHPSL